MERLMLVGSDDGIKVLTIGDIYGTITEVLRRSQLTRLKITSSSGQNSTRKSGPQI